MLGKTIMDLASMHTPYIMFHSEQLGKIFNNFQEDISYVLLMIGGKTEEYIFTSMANDIYEFVKEKTVYHEYPEYIRLHVVELSKALVGIKTSEDYY